MVASNTTAYTWDWYSHLVGDRASLTPEANAIKHFLLVTYKWDK
jgi:hypothetical protein